MEHTHISPVFIEILAVQVQCVTLNGTKVSCKAPELRKKQKQKNFPLFPKEILCNDISVTNNISGIKYWVAFQQQRSKLSF